MSYIHFKVDMNNNTLRGGVRTDIFSVVKLLDFKKMCCCLEVCQTEILHYSVKHVGRLLNMFDLEKIYVRELVLSELSVQVNSAGIT